MRQPTVTAAQYLDARTYEDHAIIERMPDGAADAAELEEINTNAAVDEIMYVKAWEPYATLVKITTGADDRAETRYALVTIGA